MLDIYRTITNYLTLFRAHLCDPGFVVCHFSEHLVYIAVVSSFMDRIIQIICILKTVFICQELKNRGHCFVVGS